MALEIFKLFGSIMVDNEKANESIAKTDKKAEGLGNKFMSGVGTAAKWGAGIATAAGTAAGALVGVATNSANTLDRIDKLSEKIGISKQAFQEWDYVLSQNGMDAEKITSRFKNIGYTDGRCTKWVEKLKRCFFPLSVCSGRIIQEN